VFGKLHGGMAERRAGRGWYQGIALLMGRRSFAGGGKFGATAMAARIASPH
jgi:hypothetical protein